jgi:hypothetical protein
VLLAFCGDARNAYNSIDMVYPDPTSIPYNPPQIISAGIGGERLANVGSEMSTALLYALGFGGVAAGLLFLIHAARKRSTRRA